MPSLGPLLERRTTTATIDRPIAQSEPRMMFGRRCAMARSVAMPSAARLLVVAIIRVSSPDAAGRRRDRSRDRRRRHARPGRDGHGRPRPGRGARAAARRHPAIRLRPGRAGEAGTPSSPRRASASSWSRCDVGWGDCESGCIDEHSWVYAIGPDGTSRRLRIRLTGATRRVAEPGWSRQDRDRGVAVAGPVCPVERVPPDPACAARPVADATIVIRDASGSVGRAGRDRRGWLVPRRGPARRLPGRAATGGGSHGRCPGPVGHRRDGPMATVQLDYDTGIR